MENKKEEIVEEIDIDEDDNQSEEIKEKNIDGLTKEQEDLLEEIKKLRNKKIIIRVLSVLLIIDIALLVMYLIGIDNFLSFIK